MSRPPGGDTRTYPLQPLLDASGHTRGQLGLLLGVGGGTVTTAARDGLTLSQADRWSLRLGLMPEEVWPDMFLRIEEGAA